MANRRIRWARIAASLASLAVGIFIAGCSPNLSPSIAGVEEAGKQTADLVDWLNDAATKSPARAATPSSESAADAPAQLHLMLSRAPRPTVHPAQSGEAAGQEPCLDKLETVTVTVKAARDSAVQSTDAVRSAEDRTQDLNNLTNFLYGLPNSDDGRRSLYDGDL
jgi:hypothetical protein